jgi:uncharacterized metal-binding protein YceD (DUF177 family)
VSKRGVYAVRISGLSDGEHEFSFDLDRTFFATLEPSEIESGKLRADIRLQKKPGLLTLHFHISGTVEVTCDRCLEHFPMEVDTRQDLFVKTGDTPGEIEDDVIMIHPEDHEIEVDHFLYEYIVLSLPVKKVHPENEEGKSGCDQEMIGRIAALHGEREKDSGTDPRWDTLKQMIKKTDSHGTS